MFYKFYNCYKNVLQIDLIPNVLQELLSVRVRNEGEFWMSFDDFAKQFSHLDLVHIGYYQHEIIIIIILTITMFTFLVMIIINKNNDINNYYYSHFCFSC